MQGRLADQMALLASFNLGLLDGIRLQERVQVLLLAPMAVEVVVAHLAGLKVGDEGIAPAGELDARARREPQS